MNLDRTRQRWTAWITHPALPWVFLGGLTLLALLLRLFKLGQWSFWIDEIYTLDRVAQFWKEFPAPAPVSTILTALTLRAFPLSEWSARLAPALIGTLTLPILFFPVRKIFGTWVALLTTLLLALSPWHLLWSQNARFYTALTLFYTLALLIFYIGLEEDNPWYLLFSFAFLGLATFERKMALFYAPIVVVYLALVVWIGLGNPKGLRKRNLIAMATPVVLVGLFEVYVVLFAGQEAFYAKFLEIFIGHRHNPIRVFFSVIVDLGLPQFLLALAGGFFLWKQRSRAGFFLLLCVGIPLVAIVLIAPFAQTFSRYVFHTLPFWAILAAVAMQELMAHLKGASRWLGVGVLILLIAEPLSQDLLYYAYQNGNRQDWKGAFQVVEAGYKAGDWIVTTRPEVGDYYLEGEVTWTQGLSPKEVTRSGQRAWFVIDDQTGFVSPEMDSFLQEDTQLVAVRDIYLPGKPVKMRVYLYNPAVVGLISGNSP